MKDTKEADEMVFTLSFQIDNNKITVESHEVDSIQKRRSTATIGSLGRMGDSRETDSAQCR